MTTDPLQQGSPTLKFLSIVGARPQFVKLAPICRAIEAHNKLNSANIQHCIVHTGQHYEPEIADIFFLQMGIPEPRYNLAVGSASPGVQLGKMLERLDPVLSEERPDWVLVYGDTNSTFAGAFLATRLHFPLAHIEAGCRSGDLTMPEEQNRILTDQLSQLLFAPSVEALRNLEREGFSAAGDSRGRSIVFAGDLTYDALLANLKLAENRGSEVLDHLALKPHEYYLLTLHRTCNTDQVDKLRSIIETASTLDFPVLFPVHPRTRNVLSAAGITLGGSIRPVTPLGYLEMLHVEKHARKILTDSGGVQKEAFYLGVPCVTLRDETEWPDTVESGANRTVGANPDKIRRAVQSKYPEHWQNVKPYGNGDAAIRIVDELLARSLQVISS